VKYTNYVKSHQDPLIHGCTRKRRANLRQKIFMINFARAFELEGMNTEDCVCQKRLWYTETMSRRFRYVCDGGANWLTDSILSLFLEDNFQRSWFNHGRDVQMWSLFGSAIVQWILQIVCPYSITGFV